MLAEQPKPLTKKSSTMKDQCILRNLLSPVRLIPGSFLGRKPARSVFSPVDVTGAANIGSSRPLIYRKQARVRAFFARISRP